MAYYGLLWLKNKVRTPETARSVSCAQQYGEARKAVTASYAWLRLVTLNYAFEKIKLG
jgi:hypothetical protein